MALDPAQRGVQRYGQVPYLYTYRRGRARRLRNRPILPLIPENARCNLSETHLQEPDCLDDSFALSSPRGLQRMAVAQLDERNKKGPSLHRERGRLAR